MSTKCGQCNVAMIGKLVARKGKQLIEWTCPKCGATFCEEAET